MGALGIDRDTNIDNDYLQILHTIQPSCQLPYHTKHDITSLKQCSKLVVAQLPETTRTLFGQPVFRKNNGPVARDCMAFAIGTTWIFS